MKKSYKEKNFKLRKKHQGKKQFVNEEVNEVPKLTRKENGKLLSSDDIDQILKKRDPKKTGPK